MIRVVLADGLEMVRGGLVALLERESDIKVVAAIDTGRDMVQTVLEFSPDVAVIDVERHESLLAAMAIQEHLPDCRTLLIADSVRLSTVRESVASGLGGLMLKSSSPAHLGGGIRNVYEGRRVFDPDMTLAAWGNGGCPLTDREMDVLRLAAVGDGTEEIALKLSLSPGTVRNYLATVVRKVDARNRIDAVRIAYVAGWI
ncbi:DNA-binding response regulator [Streptomyces sp. SID4937]|nr:DNA-binding response regulator [Streptomyces sp. SID4937]